MNLLELQQRANVLVEKANAYEDSLQGVTWNEQEIINQHKYTDIYSLRPIMKLLFGSSITEKTNRTLDNDVALRVFASTAPMWNSSFNLLSYKREGATRLYFGSSSGELISSSRTIDLSPFQIDKFSDPETDFLDITLKGTVTVKNTNTIFTRNILYLNITNDDNILQYFYWDYNGNQRSLSTYLGSDKSSYLGVGSGNLKNVNSGFTNIPFNLKFRILPSSTDSSYKLIKLLSGSMLNNKTTTTTYTYSGSHANKVNNSLANLVVKISAPNTDNISCTFDLANCFVEGKIKSQSVDYKSDQHEFMNDIHNYNNSNLITLDVKQNTLTDRSTRIKQGINYSYSANIQDALVTESQVANVFKWNTTTPQDIKNNTITVSRQVPGIVCYYLGNDYNGEYTATIPYNPGTMKLNQINYSTPPSYGAFYTTDPTTSQVPVRQGVLEEDIGHEACRIFIPGMHFTRGKLESPQQIWQPDMKFGDSNTGLGYNWQGQALYHELVFKNRRSGSKKSNVDFVSTPDTVADNDPQGLATRFALAQQKKYYKNRPWFNELDELVDLDPTRLQKIIENNSYITTSGGSFDKSKFTVATGGELDDNGILNDCSKKVSVTGLNIPLVDELTIYGPKITFDINYTGSTSGSTMGFIVGKTGDTGFFNQDSDVSVGQSVGGGNITSTINNVYQNDQIWRYDIDNIQNTILKSGTYQYIYNLKKTNDNIVLTVTILNTSTNTTWATYTRTQAGSSFNITDMWIGNDSLKSGETSKVYDLSPIKIVDQDDTVLFSAQSEASKTYMTDEQFYNQFKLDYDMFARAFNLPQ